MKLPFPKDEHHKRMGTVANGTNGHDVLFDLSDTSVISNGNGTVNGNGNTNGNGYASSQRLMVDKAVQYDTQMDTNDNADFPRGSSNNHTPQEEKIISPEWSPSALNETIPVHSKVESTDATIKAWRKEIESVTSSSETQQKPPQQPPNTDDGARCKLNNDSYPTARDDDNHDHNNTSTWRVRDHNRSSSGSEDEIEKISESIIDIRGIGEREKSGTSNDRRCGQEENRTGGPSKPGQPRNQDEEGEDCLIQCLSYTLQCCECVIS